MSTISEYCTYSQGAYGAAPNGGNPATILQNSFESVYPLGVVIGDTSLAGKYIQFNDFKSVNEFLPTGGPAGQLTMQQTITNSVPSPSTAGGILSGQVLALTIDIDLNDKNIISVGTNPKFGDIFICNLPAPYTPLNGLTIRAFLTEVNKVLSGQVSLPFLGLTIGQWNTITESLVLSYDNCLTSNWARDHLCLP